MKSRNQGLWTRFLSCQIATLFFCCCFSVSAQPAWAQTKDCGRLDERQCQQCWETVPDGPVGCGKPYCESNSGLTLQDNKCTLDRSIWQGKDIDWTRREPIRGSLSACGDKNAGQENCWQQDDQERDHLNMTSSMLNEMNALKAGSKLKDGRYIYVYRKTDNKFLVRRYDRGTTCQAYENYRYSGNYRDNGETCDAKKDQRCTYLHVRHSQLNDGWSDVWCAGELRVNKGKVDRVNNESGHFKPGAQCVTDYVQKTLRGYGLAIADGDVFGDYTTHSAAEDKCPKATGSIPGKDEL